MSFGHWSGDRPEPDVRPGELYPSDADADAAVRRLRDLTERVGECRDDVDTVIAMFDRLRS